MYTLRTQLGDIKGQAPVSMAFVVAVTVAVTVEGILVTVDVIMAVTVVVSITVAVTVIVPKFRAITMVSVGTVPLDVTMAGVANIAVIIVVAVEIKLPTYGSPNRAVMHHPI